MQQVNINNTSNTEGGVGRQNARSDRVCLDFLVLLDQAKRIQEINVFNPIIKCFAFLFQLVRRGANRQNPKEKKVTSI